MTELEITNIALRGLNEPAVAALADSPLATIARDRCLEWSKQVQALGQWNFAQATYKLSTTIGVGANRIPWQSQEQIIETTSNASMTLIAMDKKVIWVRLDTGTATGGQLLTGQESGAIRNGGVLGSALDVDDAWALADLPDLLGRWIAREAALDLEREYKMGAIDEQILRDQLLRARAEFMDWDAMWGNANINDMPSVKGPSDEFTILSEDDDNG